MQYFNTYFNFTRLGRTYTQHKLIKQGNYLSIFLWVWILPAPLFQFFVQHLIYNYELYYTKASYFRLFFGTHYPTCFNPLAPTSSDFGNHSSKCLTYRGLGEAEASNHDSHRNLRVSNTWVIFCYISTCISMKHDWKFWDSNWRYVWYGMWLYQDVA